MRTLLPATLRLPRIELTQSAEVLAALAPIVDERTLAAARLVIYQVCEAAAAKRKSAYAASRIAREALAAAIAAADAAYAADATRAALVAAAYAAAAAAYAADATRAALVAAADDTTIEDLKQSQVAMIKRMCAVPTDSF